mmetsp:Transcript_2957/g.5068  ORF Transcript_2957/g.5068 Transcript_2957/m.5068 type:complete len:460 (-) Transcript_2957:296-1675(-)
MRSCLHCFCCCLRCCLGCFRCRLSCLRCRLHRLRRLCLPAGFRGQGVQCSAAASCSLAALGLRLRMLHLAGLLRHVLLACAPQLQVVRLFGLSLVQCGSQLSRGLRHFHVELHEGLESLKRVIELSFGRLSLGKHRGRSNSCLRLLAGLRLLLGHCIRGVHWLLLHSPETLGNLHLLLVLRCSCLLIRWLQLSQVGKQLLQCENLSCVRLNHYSVCCCAVCACACILSCLCSITLCTHFLPLLPLLAIDETLVVVPVVVLLDKLASQGGVLIPDLVDLGPKCLHDVPVLFLLHIQSWDIQLSFCLDAAHAVQHSTFSILLGLDAVKDPIAVGKAGLDVSTGILDGLQLGLQLAGLLDSGPCLLKLLKPLEVALLVLARLVGHLKLELADLQVKRARIWAATRQLIPQCTQRFPQILTGAAVVLGLLTNVLFLPQHGLELIAKGIQLVPDLIVAKLIAVS